MNLQDGHCILGQAINILQAPTSTALHLKWVKEFPDAPLIRYLHFFGNEALVCNSLDTCREVLQTHCYSIPKSNWWKRSTKNIIGKGLLGQGAADHKVHRKMLAAPFSPPNITKLHPLFTAKAQELSAVLGRAIEHGSVDGITGVVDCSEIFMKAFLDVIGVAVLGKELANLSTVGLEPGAEDEEHPLHRAFAEFFAPPSKLKQILTFASGFLPVRWIPLQANHDFNSAMTALHAVVKSLVEERVAEVKSLSGTEKRGKNSSTDLLTFIVEETLPGGSAEGMPEDILKDHVSLK